MGVCALLQHFSNFAHCEKKIREVSFFLSLASSCQCSLSFQGHAIKASSVVSDLPMNQVLCSICRFQSKEEWQALVSVSFLPSRGLLSGEASTCRLGMLHRLGGKGYALNNLVFPPTPSWCCDPFASHCSGIRSEKPDFCRKKTFSFEFYWNTSRYFNYRCCFCGSSPR